MKYLNALNKINGVGAQKLKLLLDYFENGENIWQAPVADIINVGISEKLAHTIISERPKINPDYEWELLQKEDIQVIPFTSSEFPASLKEISSTPYLIYVKGDLNIFSQPMLAMVGSRKFTSYGKQIAESLARDLATAGIVVVSGMAMGIDTFSHQGALMANGKTIAVLGSGLDNNHIGPRQNFNLSRKIIANGALISDYPYGTQATNFTFPARNRLMAGLTMGTIVVEAEEKSGTLITANLAVDFNREVFAVPGSIFSPASQGANQLIKRGAKVITGVQDILEELNLEKLKQEKIIKKIIPDTLEEELIIKNISTEATHIDRIIKATRLNTSIASSTLAILEIKGIIKDIGGQNYIIL
ncbi:MAG TPA: DNA-protecting protein DprA [Candidatus Moranbacteria bacterium]|nr:DNA-protecting protein DprA [Candidatus Moranbacteria bacterium]